MFRDFCRNGLFFRESGGSFDHIKLYNVLYLPRKQEFTYNYNVHLSKGLVNYYESLNLWHLDSSRYATRQDLFSEL